MSPLPPSQVRRDFEALAREGKDWGKAAVVYNGLAMFEMLPAYGGLTANRQKLKDAVNAMTWVDSKKRMQYAFAVVDDMQMPDGNPPGDLRATGQEEDAREFLAPVPVGLSGFQFSDLLALYPQGTPSAAKSVIGGKVDAEWIDNTCAIRVSRVLDYSGGPAIPAHDPKLHVVSGADHRWYSYRQKELQGWFTTSFGAPSMTLGASPNRRKLKNLQGFIAFDIHFADATGHFDLWDGNVFQLEAQATHDYFVMAKTVLFWRVPSWKRTP